jgi:hypothetical protein
MAFGWMKCARWIAGIEVPAREGGTGFDMEALAPTRRRTLLERGIAALTTLTAALALLADAMFESEIVWAP